MSQIQPDLKRRRVVTGYANGSSTILADGQPPMKFESPTFSTVEVWRTVGSPASLGDVETTDIPVQLGPSEKGLLIRYAYFMPEEAIDDADIGTALDEIGGANSHDDQGDKPGMHTTDTVDVVHVVSGQIYAVLDDTETLLEAGDVIVQRGTRHAWHNRSSEVCVILAIQCDADPESRPDDN